ncbi:hypothetical protein ASPBRDRAFT_490312 [Aspergillus brasiliensis CBS 101740]|uniref:Uncharacterized protein n=1 Tax=Aspergillus brasiliensis (strain CBS 101740 / IMI 381727 / IBT 21946) TaxID=767769 RepID=A0A1L9U226_ASPBC|nr:hypothetical protein ASPBRDRAFT_490312 [Aspergillus brasiliensis CBS 101740]
MQTHIDDSLYLFIDHLHADKVPMVETVTGFFVRRCVYFFIFGDLTSFPLLDHDPNIYKSSTATVLHDEAGHVVSDEDTADDTHVSGRTGRGTGGQIVQDHRLQQSIQADNSAHRARECRALEIGKNQANENRKGWRQRQSGCLRRARKLGRRWYEQQKVDSGDLKSHDLSSVNCDYGIADCSSASPAFSDSTISTPQRTDPSTADPNSTERSTDLGYRGDSDLASEVQSVSSTPVPDFEERSDME